MIDSFVIFTDCKEQIDMLTAPQKGMLLDALMRYASDLPLPVLDPITTMCFSVMRQKVDYCADKYAEKSEKRRAAANARWNSDANASDAMQTDAKNANASFAMQEDANECNAMQTMHHVTDTDTDIKRESTLTGTKEKAKRFTPPTVEEVQEYCRERGNKVDAQTFVDFCASKGWVVGKSPMKDWKAAVRTWEKDRSNKPPDRPPKKTNFDFEQRHTDYDALLRGV